MSMNDKDFIHVKVCVLQCAVYLDQLLNGVYADILLISTAFINILIYCERMVAQYVTFW